VKKKVMLILIAALLISALGTQVGLSKEKEAAAIDTAEIMHKLNEILANQAEALEQFAEIKQELAIIKVRASRR